MREVKIWKLGDNHKWYGRVVMMRTIEGEPYRFFQDGKGSVAMMPLSVLQMEKKE